MSRTNPSTPDLTPCTTWFLWASAPPREVSRFPPAVLATFKALGVEPTRMLVTVGGDVRRRKFTLANLVAAVADPNTVDVAVMASDVGVGEVSLRLRDWSGYERFTDRRAILYSNARHSIDDLAIIDLMRLLVDEYPVVHGGAAMMPTRWHASTEASLVGHGGVGISTEMEQRIHFDAMNVDEAMTRLRRLYPVTIIGPDIWAKLPPIPDVEPRVKVEDLGNCKMLTCWPELVAPDDLQFLLGTRELRRWLWPYTIQNPADNPDEVDSRLRWAELLPW